MEGDSYVMEELKTVMVVGSVKSSVHDKVTSKIKCSRFVNALWGIQSKGEGRGDRGANPVPRFDLAFEFPQNRDPSRLHPRLRDSYIIGMLSGT